MINAISVFSLFQFVADLNRQPHTPTRVHAYTRTRAYAYTRTCVHAYTRTRAHVYTCTYIHAYMRAVVYTYGFENTDFEEHNLKQMCVDVKPLRKLCLRLNTLQTCNLSLVVRW